MITKSSEALNFYIGVRIIVEGKTLVPGIVEYHLLPAFDLELEVGYFICQQVFRLGRTFSFPSLIIISENLGQSVCYLLRDLRIAMTKVNNNQAGGRQRLNGLTGSQYLDILKDSLCKRNVAICARRRESHEQINL